MSTFHRKNCGTIKKIKKKTYGKCLSYRVAVFKLREGNSVNVISPRYTPCLIECHYNLLCPEQCRKIAQIFHCLINSEKIFFKKNGDPSRGSNNVDMFLKMSSFIDNLKKL